MESRIRKKQVDKVNTKNDLDRVDKTDKYNALSSFYSKGRSREKEKSNKNSKHRRGKFQ